MADFGVREGHVDAVLSQFSRGYTNGAFIADLLFPILPVKFESDKYAVFGTEKFRRESALRADKAVSKEIGLSWDFATYTCEAYAMHTRISKRERDNTDASINLERRKTELATDAVLLDREVRAYTLAAASGSWADTDVPSVKWDVASGVDPIGDVLNALEKQRILSKGKRANLMVLPPAVFAALTVNATLQTKFQYTADGNVTLERLRNLWGIERIVMPQIMVDSAQEGDTASIGDLWGDTVGLFYVGPVAQETQTAGLTFRSKAFEVARWYDPETKCDVIEPEVIEVVKVIDNTCGFLLTDVLT